MKTPRIAAVLIAAVPCASLALAAGPIDPPVGPVAPTFKTLTEVEPRIVLNAANTPGDANNLFKITQPGSYYLTGNITGVAGKTAVLINAHHVTLDLNGFTITGGLNGIATVPPPGSGILTSAHVTNGAVTGCAGTGVKLSSTFAAIIDNVRVDACTNVGIECNWRFMIRNCETSFCGTGFSLGTGGHILDCSAHDSAATGFSCGSENLVERCNAFFGDGDAFVAGSETALRDCLAARNGGAGFEVANGCTVERCQATQSGLTGILAATGVSVRDCDVSGGQADGISVGNECSVISNTVHDNAVAGGVGTGIRVAANDCAVQDNRVSNNGNWGIYVSGTGNFVARNWSRSHSTQNLFIAANNDSGPISNAAGVGAASSNPWANFTR